MSTRQPDDAASIAASLDRPEVFDDVFRRHFAAVYRFAARHLGESEGEEVAAETFARAARCAPSWRAQPTRSFHRRPR